MGVWLPGAIPGVSSVEATNAVSARGHRRPGSALKNSTSANLDVLGETLVLATLERACDDVQKMPPAHPLFMSSSVSWSLNTPPAGMPRRECDPCPRPRSASLVAVVAAVAAAAVLPLLLAKTVAAQQLVDIGCIARPQSLGAVRQPFDPRTHSCCAGFAFAGLSQECDLLGLGNCAVTCTCFNQRPIGLPGNLLCKPCTRVAPQFKCGNQLLTVELYNVIAPVPQPPPPPPPPQPATTAAPGPQPQQPPVADPIPTITQQPTTVQLPPTEPTIAPAPTSRVAQAPNTAGPPDFPSVTSTSPASATTNIGINTSEATSATTSSHSGTSASPWSASSPSSQTTLVTDGYSTGSVAPGSSAWPRASGPVAPTGMGMGTGTGNGDGVTSSANGGKGNSLAVVLGSLAAVAAVCGLAMAAAVVRARQARRRQQAAAEEDAADNPFENGGRRPSVAVTTQMVSDMWKYAPVSAGGSSLSPSPSPSPLSAVPGGGGGGGWPESPRLGDKLHAKVTNEPVILRGGMPLPSPSPTTPTATAIPGNNARFV
ncbi:hypothetical protein DFJ73DRAFT_780869 [Zopfochytrium polystomum]|nr:hypothetical protein DFJ73DRAFT_780869 [Zopfochytrium polystomum]